MTLKSWKILTCILGFLCVLSLGVNVILWRHFNELLAQFSQATILFDSGAGAAKPGISVLGGLAEISPGPAIVARRQAPGGRWFIPAKIQPVIYGDAAGASYFYFDPKTQKLDGPYIPVASSK